MNGSKQKLMEVHQNVTETPNLDRNRLELALHISSSLENGGTRNFLPLRLRPSPPIRILRPRSPKAKDLLLF